MASTVSAFAGGDHQMVVKARIKLYQRPDASSVCYRYLDEGEKVSVFSKTDDGWLKVGTAYKFDTGKRMIGYINPDLTVVNKAKAPAPTPSASSTSDGTTKTITTATEPSPPTTREITLVSNVSTVESQLKDLEEKKNAELSSLRKDLDAQKKALATETAAAADKDKAIEVLRVQAADAATKLSAVQSSVEDEAFRVFSAKASTVKLRGFGPVKLVPLLDDYLVIISPDLAKGVDTFFAKIRKVVHVGKSATYMVCDRKYFVPASPPMPDMASGSESGRTGGQ
jgi:hypothetical protein